MDKKSLLIGGIIVIVVIILILLLQWRAGQVVLDIGQEEFKVGDNLGGTLSLTIEPGDSLEKDIPILISLTKNNKVEAVTTITLDEFIQTSDNPILPVERNGTSYYETPATHALQINKIIDYQFKEKGEYELFFNIFSIDLTVKRTIIVF